MYHSRVLRIRPASFTPTRAFHQSRARLIKAGDAFPDITVMEDSPGNKLSLAQVLKKQPQALVIGVPAAFSPACSSTHIPGYVAAKSGIPSYVVSVNDPFVMKAWKEQLVDSSTSADFRFIADPAGELTKALEMDWDSEAMFGNRRSKRYAMYVRDGTVRAVFAEPDNTGVAESAANEVLEAIKKLK